MSKELEELKEQVTELTKIVTSVVKQDDEPTVDDKTAKARQLQDELDQIYKAMTPVDHAKQFAIENGCDLKTAVTAIRLGQAKQNSAVLTATMRYRPRVSYGGVNRGLQSVTGMINHSRLGF